MTSKEALKDILGILMNLERLSNIHDTQDIKKQKFGIIEKDLDLEIYFADLHAPWQRGSNENINGLLRFFFPRGTDFRKVTRVQLDAVLDKINNRPRKCLDILSPIDYFNQSVALGLTI